MAPQGDTLVIVRNCQGVQAGDHNLQHNEFRIKVSDVDVRVDRADMTSQRQECISRLRENPDDRAAARSLADDLGRAAGKDLMADVTARIEQVAGNSQIPGWPGHLRDRDGIQAGGPGNHVHVRVDVKAEKFDADALARSLRTAAMRLPRPQPPSRPERDTPRPGDTPPRTSPSGLWPPRGSPLFPPGQGPWRPGRGGSAAG